MEGSAARIFSSDEIEGELRAFGAREEPPLLPLPPLHLKLSQASPPTTWRREEIYNDDGR
jgi:hypothetical protein